MPRPVRADVAMVVLALSIVVFCNVDGFSSRAGYVRRPTELAVSSQSRPSSGGVAQQVQPLTSSSNERRRKVLSALNRKKMDNALNGVDAEVLELLSEQFLYPSDPAAALADAAGAGWLYSPGRYGRCRSSWSK